MPPSSNYLSASFCTRGKYELPGLLFANTFLHVTLWRRGCEKAAARSCTAGHCFLVSAKSADQDITEHHWGRKELGAAVDVVGQGRWADTHQMKWTASTQLLSPTSSSQPCVAGHILHPISAFALTELIPLIKPDKSVRPSLNVLETFSIAVN